ncbi:MAG: hypothetical protein A2846_02665 [Candidatus Doudnabacteria bacterium RIFCSPHIGHO2_01_FULL_49_9]|uniref:Methylamine utilisation protein MauE domain-containing protein n=1 Tax=Candidatus Doudnabacteria bacterium RIFCSPHIGHO2_01_FULL_49_9 TaxID=1817827 RepID=A0A1F5P3L4_9BACT|nr:MAG: hypothetical protein A2846_02665 [Candidatus Doudnabacteria bacterium RIFCSPHIGHO2_01_FULL_49_9]
MLISNWKKDRLISFLLRIGLASVFLYAALAAFMDPDTWANFLPKFLRDMFPDQIRYFLMAFSLYELALVAVLLLDKFVYWAAIFSALTMVGILVFNAQGMDVIFRDVAIMFMAAALAVLKKDEPAA